MVWNMHQSQTNTYGIVVCIGGMWGETYMVLLS